MFELITDYDGVPGEIPVWCAKCRQEFVSSIDEGFLSCIDLNYRFHQESKSALIGAAKTALWPTQ